MITRPAQCTPFRLSLNSRRIALAGAFLATLATGFAQLGDSADPAGTPQEMPGGIVAPPAPALSPEEALQTFQLPPGFRIELVASEPLVSTPVVMDFDAQGRIWVVEMQSYMPNADGRGEVEPSSRIVILEDTDADGRMDQSTVYMEGLILPRAVKVLEQGVLVGAPPHLWFTRDDDGDGRMDSKVAIASDFSTPQTNPEHGANALIWGMDNWIGLNMYDFRYRLKDGAWIKSPAFRRGSWGASIDDYGRHFVNGNSDYLRADLVPYHYHARNPHLFTVDGREVAAGGSTLRWMRTRKSGRSGSIPG